MAAFEPFLQATYRSNFISGWDQYVEREAGFGFGNPPDNVYWNPRMGQWQTYGADQWRFIDENLPSLGPFNFTTNAGDVFEQITSQWSALPAQQQQSAIWDGRRHRWVLGQRFPEPAGVGSCRQDYEEKLAFLRQLHSVGKLEDSQFARQAEELWKSHEHCV